MSYIVLARKYRPQNFDEVVGQSFVCQVLKNSITQERIGHAYIFSGQRGTGKTTIARIYAKALNCLKGPTPSPCGKCINCTQITEGSSMDVLEIDGASNNGIDEIRALRENVKFTPANSKYKIYIIDEAHQITPNAFNALLKTIEEPPSHTLFILATTESQKIPLTIQSRCQRFRFSPIPTEDIAAKLLDISKKEKFSIEEEAINVVAEAANGSLRDSLSILDQAMSVNPEEKVTYKAVIEFLGLNPVEFTASFVDLLIKKDNRGIIEKINQIAQQGYDFLLFARELREYLHKLMLILVINDENSPELRKYTPEEKKFLLRQKSGFDERKLLRDLQLLNRCLDEMKWSDNQRLVFEVYMLKLVQPFVNIDEVIAKIENLSRGIPANNCADYSGTRQAVKEELIKPVSEEVVRLTEPAREVSAQDSSGIDSQWQSVIEKLGETKIRLASSLENVVEKKFINNTLTIYIPEGLHYDTVKDSQKIIEKAVKDAFGEKVRFVFEPTKSKPKPVINEKFVDGEGEEQASEIVVDDIKNNDEVMLDQEVKKVIDGFQGKIISKKEKVR